MRFHILKHPNRQTDSLTEYFCQDGPRTGVAPRCPTCNRFVGMLPWLPPYCVELRFWGRKHGDIAFGAVELLVSERFVDLYRKSGLSGLTILGSADVIKVRPRGMTLHMPKYLVARVERSKALFDDTASGVSWEKKWTCPECRSGQMLRCERIVVDERTWNGEDVFIATGLAGKIITSERFKWFCSEHIIEGAELIPALEYSINFGGK